MSSSVVLWLRGGQEELLWRKVQALLNGNYCNKQSRGDIAFWQPSSSLPAAELQPWCIFNLFLPKQVPWVSADVSAQQHSSAPPGGFWLFSDAVPTQASVVPCCHSLPFRPTSTLHHCPCKCRGRFQLLSVLFLPFGLCPPHFFTYMGHSPK